MYSFLNLIYDTRKGLHVSVIFHFFFFSSSHKVKIKWRVDFEFFEIIYTGLFFHLPIFSFNCFSLTFSYAQFLSTCLENILTPYFIFDFQFHNNIRIPVLKTLSILIYTYTRFVFPISALSSKWSFMT